MMCSTQVHMCIVYVEVKRQPCKVRLFIHLRRLYPPLSLRLLMLTTLPMKILACLIKQITTKPFVHLAENPMTFAAEFGVCGSCV